MKKIVKLILITLIILLVPYNINALNITTNTRTPDNNYGVNKHWKITNDNLNNINNTPYVDATQKIYDFSNILTAEEENQLLIEIKDFINLTNMDMVILTYDLPYTVDSQNETFAADFYDYNDFGIDFKNYSGVLLFRNTYTQDRYYDIYTFGDAQLYFGYNRLNSTLDNIYYDFVDDRYLNGISSFINDMNNYYNLGIDSEYDNYYVDKDGYLREKYNPPILIALIIATIATTIIMTILIKKNKMVKKASKADEYLNTNSIIYSEKVDKYTHSRTSSYRVSSSSSGSSGGGRSSSRGSSGGGHSSGGGRHG